MRTESDFLGERTLPKTALYGIHSLRAAENFPDSSRFQIEWYQAMGQVKLACYKTYEAFRGAIARSGKPAKGLHTIEQVRLNAMLDAAAKVAAGEHFDQFIVPAIQGGAGTSINMNVNEIIANLALMDCGYVPGQYAEIHPIEDANIYQSTNDVVPTALRVATMVMLKQLEESINRSRAAFEGLEKQYHQTPRMGYTQMQEAVPTTFGRYFSTWADAFGRDWWRVSKAFERIKEVNLGGSAIGTSAAVPRYFAMQVVQHLQQLTALPITRAENLQDITANLDSFVEVHAILKAHAVNLEKMSSDLRLLASDIAGRQQLRLPAVQMGSTIMPGKVNPVIAEYIISMTHQVYSNDALITRLCGQGCLELNAYLPAIGHALLGSIKGLQSCNLALANKLLTGLGVNVSGAWQQTIASPAITTLLVPALGYAAATRIAEAMRQNGWTIFEANQHLQFLPDNTLTKMLSPSEITKGGFTIDDLEAYNG